MSQYLDFAIQEPCPEGVGLRQLCRRKKFLVSQVEASYLTTFLKIHFLDGRHLPVKGSGAKINALLRGSYPNFLRGYWWVWVGWINRMASIVGGVIRLW